MRNFKIITLLLAMVFASQAIAQGLVDDPQPDMPPFGEGPHHEKMRERIETLKVWKLTEQLDLTTEKSQKFFPVYNKFQDDRKVLEEERRQIFRELNRLVDAENPDEPEIKKVLDKLDAFDDRTRTRRAQFRQELKDILTIKQIGQLYVFEVQFRQQMRGIIQDARKGMRRGHFPGQP